MASRKGRRGGGMAATHYRSLVTVAAQFTAGGSLTAAVTAVSSAAALFAASGTLTAITGTSTSVQVAAPFTGGGALTAANAGKVAVAAPFTGGGALTAAVQFRIAVAAPFTASAALTTVIVGPGAGFVHPGVLLTGPMITFTASSIGSAPWAGAYATLVAGLNKNSSQDPVNNVGKFYSDTTWVPHPQPIVYRTAGGGGGSSGDKAEQTDAQAAWVQALVFAYTGNRTAGNNAVIILNSWMTVLTDHPFDQVTYTDGKLQAAWCGSLFPRAAEVMRALWVPSGGDAVLNVAAAVNCFENAFVPRIFDGWTGGAANWLASMAEAMIAIGTFCDDRTTFNTGLANWRGATPGAVYKSGDVNGHAYTGGGSANLPIAPVGTIYDADAYSGGRAGFISYWYSPTTTPPWINGLQEEVGRDPWHSAMGIAAMINGAETAWHQGVDLYGEQQTRIVTGLELFAGWINDVFVNAVNPPVTGGAWPFAAAMANNGANNSQRVTLEIAYNHYHNRRGVSMPNTLAVLTNYCRTGTYNVNLHMAGENVTHRDNPGVLRLVAAPFTGVGTLTAVNRQKTAVAAAFTGGGALTATAVQAVPIAVPASFTGAGSFTALTAQAGMFTAENGTNGTALTAGNVPATSVTTAGSGTATFSNTVAHSGGLSYKFLSTTSTDTSYMRIPIQGGTGQLHAAASSWFYVPALPIGSNHRLQTMRSAAAYTAALIYRTDGTIALQDITGATIAASATVIPTGQWFQVITDITVATSTTGSGAIRLYLTGSGNPTETINFTSANLGTAATTASDVGKSAATGTASAFTVYVDDITLKASTYTAPPFDTPSGAYVGSGQPALAATLGTARGLPLAFATDYLAWSTTWAALSDASWWCTQWSGTRLCLGVGMFPNDGVSTMALGAAGTYDHYFTTIATTLVAGGQANAILRIGWEFNGSVFPWSAVGMVADYITYYRRIVTAMRAVPGANFTFSWSISGGTTGVDLVAAYPGDAYVDYIGLDIYDWHWGNTTDTPAQRWAFKLTETYSLNWVSAFAATHNKQIGIDEWGVAAVDNPAANGGGGGDDPYFITAMYNWINTHDVAYESYFDVADHLLSWSLNPNSYAAYIGFISPGFALFTATGTFTASTTVAAALTFHVAGTPSGATAPVTAVTPTIPAGILATDITILAVCAKPYTTVITTPTGWTKIGEWQSGAISMNVDLGSVDLAVYYQLGALTPGVMPAIGGAGSNSMTAQTITYSKSSGTWDVSQFTTGIMAANFTTYTATAVSTLPLAVPDMLIGISSLDSSSGSRSGASFTATGVTQFDHQGRASGQCTTGNHIGSYWRDVHISAGTATVTPVFTFTCTTSLDGITLFLRLRAA